MSGVSPVDFIAPVEHMKRLITLPYTPGRVAFPVHRVGNALVIDGGVQQNKYGASASSTSGSTDPQRSIEAALGQLILRHEEATASAAAATAASENAAAAPSQAHALTQSQAQTQAQATSPSPDSSTGGEHTGEDEPGGGWTSVRARRRTRARRDSGGTNALLSRF